MHRDSCAVLLIMALGLAACGDDTPATSDEHRNDGNGTTAAIELDDDVMGRFVSLAAGLRDIGGEAGPTNAMLTSRGWGADDYAALEAVVAESSRRNYRAREIERIGKQLEEIKARLVDATDEERSRLQPMVVGYESNLERLRAFPAPSEIDRKNMDVMRRWQARLDDARR